MAEIGLEELNGLEMEVMRRQVSICSTGGASNCEQRHPLSFHSLFHSYIL